MEKVVLCAVLLTYASHASSASSLNPADLLRRLPSLSLPYVSSVPMPSNVPIKPTPVVTTKVVSVVTKYVYKNPVCVKAGGRKKKALCKPRHPDANSKHLERLVTKEYYVNNVDNWGRLPFGVRQARQLRQGSDLHVEASEPYGPSARSEATPPLETTAAVRDLLIEDGLDQLESLLPGYTRRRTYETSTITVTKVRSNNRDTATLLVKNCIPQGFRLCPIKLKKRKSKVAAYFNVTQLH